MRGINTFCSPLPGSAVAPLQLQLQLLPGAGEGDAPARKDAREGIRRGKRMLRQRHGATAAPEYQRYHRSLRRTHRALGESIGAAPGREGSTTARGEPGGLGGGGGLAPPRGGDGSPGMRKGSSRGIGVPVMELLGWTRSGGCGWWRAAGGMGGMSRRPPRIPRRSSARPPPAAPGTAESRPPRGWTGIFWDQIVPAWAGQTRPLGCNTTQKPPMNFLGGVTVGEAHRRMGCPNRPLFPMDRFPRVGNWDPQFSSPISTGLWGAGCSWDWLNLEWGSPHCEQGWGCFQKQDIP